MDIESNRNTPKYSRSEMFRRLLWMVGAPVFRLSPRCCFGFRRWWLRRFGARIGHQVHIYPSTVIYFPWNLTVGDWSAIGEWALIYNLGPITLGDRVTISQRAHLCAGTHDFRDPTMALRKPPITVSDGAWICADAFIGPGVGIGAGAVVGARAVVVRDVEPGVVVAGNPARVIGKR